MQQATRLGPGMFVRWRLKQHDALLESAPAGTGTIVSIDAAWVEIDVYDTSVGYPRRLRFEVNIVDLQLERRKRVRGSIERDRP